MAPDSNNDGIDDGTEWGLNSSGQLQATPRDTDSDGFPDLFDEDNDGDGVPDTVDTSPFVGPTTLFTESSPFQLTLNNLTPNISTFVDFQIRPVDPEHLWFALNVLDWPRDSVGQVQDVDDKTYADVATAAGRPAEANDANGDMKLIPMLEIRLPAGSANLPPPADLRLYNITVNDFAADGTQVAYVPLNIVSDDRNGATAQQPFHGAVDRGYGDQTADPLYPRSALARAGTGWRPDRQRLCGP